MSRNFLYIAAEFAGDGYVSFWHTVVVAEDVEAAYVLGGILYDKAPDTCGRFNNDYVIDLGELGIDCPCESCVRR